MSTRARALLITLLLPALPAPAAADDGVLRLRMEAFGRLEPGVALLVLDGEGGTGGWLTAEALVWSGYDEETQLDGNAVVVAVRARHPSGRIEGRIGRFLAYLGGLRPLHLDGVSARVRIPGDFMLEAFGGIPVVPEDDGRAWDWAVGSRVSHAIGDWGAIGIAHLHRRDGGAVADHEVAADLGLYFARALDVAGRVSIDLDDPGISEALGSVSLRTGPVRTELFASHRSPSRLVPATSLFSVLGDVPSQRYGAALSWRAAPRLDLAVRGAARRVGDDIGPSVELSALLRLDRQGRSAIGGELRREGLEGSRFTGIRGALRLALHDKVRLSTELELVVPDAPQGRGQAWPWGLIALSYFPTDAWEVAAAFQASASPEEELRTGGLLRLSYRLEVP